MHVILWEFEVDLERRAEFVAAYGPEGDWSQLFRRAEGYLGTELLASRAAVNRFVTVDRWRNVTDFLNFKRLFAGEYEAMDERMTGLTRSEVKLGDYNSAG